MLLVEVVVGTSERRRPEEDGEGDGGEHE